MRRSGVSKIAALAIVLLLAFGWAAPSRARANLAAVPPVTSCSSLVRADLSGAAEAVVTIREATVKQTSRGAFCSIVGTIAPAIGFEVDLPLKGWTQRFLQNRCGGLCGNVSMAINQAGTCAPALDGALVVAANDLGHQDRPDQPLGNWAADPQKRIDFAYRANHLTALVAKAVIRAFYGRAPRYSYFSGCSDGGREAMMEAERYPDDFDGVSAGAPVMNFQIQNSFYHAWLVASNRRADGSHILFANKLPALHAAVIAHCDALDGIVDGLLSDPRACVVEPNWAACPKTVYSPATQCLTADELAVVRRIYDGPTDGAGRHFLVGSPQPGSELQWDFIPAREGDRSFSAMIGGAMMRSMILPEASPADADLDRFTFDADTFARVTQLHSLNDATDPDLRPFARRGGKLIMWHGWSDVSVSPMISIAYYKRVQQLLGVATTDGFLRLFMLPGTGHCGGGDGFSQIDTLSPLMEWVESRTAPAQIVAGHATDRAKEPPHAGGGVPDSRQPLAALDRPATALRTIFPFPAIATPRLAGAPGSGYVAAASPVREVATIDWYGAGLIAPGYLRNYVVHDGKLSAAR